LNRFFLLDDSGSSNQGARTGARQPSSGKTLPESVFIWIYEIAGGGV
jgi:hypothetical protein